MITFSKVDSFSLKNLKRVLKVFQFGVKTAAEAAPFGDDAAPLKDMIAIFAESSNNAEPVIIGYINKNQIAAAGEKRIYSLKADGELSSYIHLKNDETIELFGAADNLVRYSKLKEGFDTLRTDLNALITAYNTHVHVSAAPGTPNAPTLSTGTASSASVDASKIENIKTN